MGGTPRAPSCVSPLCALFGDLAQPSRRPIRSAYRRHRPWRRTARHGSRARPAGASSFTVVLFLQRARLSDANATTTARGRHLLRLRVVNCNRTLRPPNCRPARYGSHDRSARSGYPDRRFRCRPPPPGRWRRQERKTPALSISTALCFCPHRVREKISWLAMMLTSSSPCLGWACHQHVDEGRK